MDQQDESTAQVNSHLRRFMEESSGQPRSTRRASLPASAPAKIPNKPRASVQHGGAGDTEIFSMSLPSRRASETKDPSIQDLQEENENLLAKCNQLRKGSHSLQAKQSFQDSAIKELQEFNKEMVDGYEVGAKTYRKLKEAYNTCTGKIDELTSEKDQLENHLKEAVVRIDQSQMNIANLVLKYKEAKAEKNSIINEQHRQIEKLLAKERGEDIQGDGDQDESENDEEEESEDDEEGEEEEESENEAEDSAQVDPSSRSNKSVNDDSSATTAPRVRRSVRPHIPENWRINWVDEIEGHDMNPEKKTYHGYTQSRLFAGNEYRKEHSDLNFAFEAMEKEREMENAKLEQRKKKLIKFRKSNKIKSFLAKHGDYLDPSKKQEIIKEKAPQQTEDAKEAKDRIMRYRTMDSFEGPIHPEEPVKEKKKKKFPGMKQMKNLRKQVKESMKPPKSQEETHLERMAEWANILHEKEEKLKAIPFCFNFEAYQDQALKELENSDSDGSCSVQSLVNEIVEEDWMEMLQAIKQKFGWHKLSAKWPVKEAWRAPLPKIFKWMVKQTPEPRPTYMRLRCHEIILQEMEYQKKDMTKVLNTLRQQEREITKQSRWHDMHWVMQRHQAQDEERRISELLHHNTAMWGLVARSYQDVRTSERQERCQLGIR